jgi:hypothetical protein
VRAAQVFVLMVQTMWGGEEGWFSSLHSFFLVKEGRRERRH